MKLRRAMEWTARRALGPLGAALLALASLTFVPAPPAAAQSPPPITVPFDHFSTGFELDGVHRDLPCESCHLNAIFKGTPRNCGVCHITGSTFNATPKTVTHIQSTNNCIACHDTTSFRPAVHFNHAEVLGSCVSCHNGTLAQGKGPTHPATSQACEACHTVLSWNPPKTVDHTQIPLSVAGFCIICHNGVAATGKPANHIVTALECGDCHLTTNWLGADFNHTGILGGCASCHDGTKAVGKQGNHMPTTNQCESCHTTGIGTKTPSWVPSKFDHTQMSPGGTCLPCHSGSQVLAGGGVVAGQPLNHVPLNSSTKDCITCHANTPAAETWTTISAGIAALHAGLTVSNCLLCHGGETFAGVPAPYTPMTMSGVSPTKLTPLAPPHIPVLGGTDCSACHGAAYTAGGFGPATAMSAAKHAFVSASCDTCHDSGKSFYVGSGTPLQLRPADHLTNSSDPRMASSDCGLCHTPTDWGSTVMPTGHMPNPGNLSCAQCHVSAPTDYTPATLAANSVLHTGVSGNCGLCHGNDVTALTWYNNYTPKDALLAPPHIPYLTGTDCSSCHSSSSYAAGTFGPMNMTPAKHAFVPTSCNTCHEAGSSFTMGAASPGLQGRPADHTTGQMVAPNDCSLCHTTANWNSNALPTGHMPTPGTQTCTVCHTRAPADYGVGSLAATAVLHTGVTGNCGQCHGGYTAALTWYNNYTPKAAFGLAPSHIPYSVGTDCSSCHAANYATGGFGPTNMSAAKHAFVPTTCDTCHDTGKSFYLGASTPALQTRPDGTGGTAAYDHIHNPSLAQMATGDCSQCHNTTVWTTPKTLPGGHMPIPGTQTCSVCHTGGTNYGILASTATLHTGISSGCAQCHGGATQLDFYHVTLPANLIKAAASLSPPHIPSFSGNDCGACHTANYVSGGFGPMNMTQATHTSVSNVTCVTCHEKGLSFYMGAANPALQLRPADHSTGTMLTSDCSACHTTANWNSSALPSGHMPNPANTACTTCHTAAPSNYTTLAANSVLHTGISSGCGQCHGGTSALTWYNNFTPKDAVLAPAHIPYLSGTDCGSCHASSTYAAGTFGPMNMTQTKHSFVTTACSTCHGTATVSFYMGAASPALQLRPSDHSSGTMLTGDCGGCHTTANWNSTALPAGHMPNPANTACNTCHTAAPGNYATLAANAVLHTGISSGCITCHGAPNATAPVFYLNYTPKSAVLSPVHIPSGATPCEDCHSNTVFTSFSGASMSSAKHTLMFGYVSATDCDACHEIGRSFYGVTKLTVRPSSGHHTGQQCGNSGCHNTNNWNAGSAKRKVSDQPATHGTVGIVVPARRTATQTTAEAGSVAGPRLGRRVANAAGVATGAEVSAAGSARLSHAGITGNCVSCHNGSLAAGKAATHIVANNSCENCHTTLAWLPARFEHRGVTATCMSCHNGVSAPGKPVRHVQTVQDCGACHGSLSWSAATFSHVGVAATCQSCHNGITATAKQVQHVSTTLDCGSCHSTLSWTVAAQPAHKLRALISLPGKTPTPRTNPRDPTGGQSQ
ncbi:MAG: hypothetical protein M3N97_16415 [Pseudomonadota bacterium]|nr:hypothetical protein [Pseudomonadota bacterium]